VRGEVIEERVYHHVADAEDALVGDTFPAEVLVGV